MELTLQDEQHVAGLGRICVPHAGTLPHTLTLSLWSGTALLASANASIDAECSRADANHMVWAVLARPMTLAAGQPYVISSTETGADAFYGTGGSGMPPAASPRVLSAVPAWRSSSADPWTVLTTTTGHMYGPVNALLL